MKFDPGEINVICTNIDHSLAFYRDVLGFELVECEGIACRLRFGDSNLLLLPIAADQPAPAGYGSTATFSLDVMVEDIHQAHEHLQAHGVAFKTDWDGEARSFHICDPDSLVLEVIQRT